MKRNVLLALAALVACAAPAMASTTLIESWENTLDGWQLPSPSGTNTTYTPGFSSTTGVTNGSYSLTASSPSAGPNYSQLLLSPSSTANTSILGNASAINLDVDTPGGSFGYYLQFQFAINNSDTGYVTLNPTYVATNIGSETTLSVPLPAGTAAALAASTNPTTIIIQAGGGYSSGNEIMYLDNLTATNLPEPASLGLLSLGALGLIRRRRA